MIARIAIISEHASPLATLGGTDSGGQNVYVAQIANKLAARGYRVDVFTRRDDPELPEIVKFINRVRIVHINAGPQRPVPKEDLLPFMDEFAANMLKFCSREQVAYRLVHANFWTSGLVAMQLKVAMGLPFVITFHALGRVRRLFQGDADRFPAARPRIEADIIAAADGIIAECPQDRSDLLKLYGAAPGKIRVIPCGFDSGELWPVDRGLARRELGLATQARVVLQLGRLVPRKGIDTVVRALGRLRHQHGADAVLLIVGGESETPCPMATPEIGRLQKIAEAEGVAEHVHFVGRRARNVLRYYYSAADVFVTTPWYEPFGITPVEAMACGTPVIGARVGGIKSTVRHGRTGFLVPPNDADAVAARLVDIFRNPELARAMGEAGRERANRYYTWSQVADRLETLYLSIVPRSGTRYYTEPNNIRGNANA
jgi:D-inositol-3-phosphate glycosyltransferase